jgi:hypothetical protein
MLDDFENRYTPKTVDDIVFEDDYSRQLIEDLITGARPFPIREGKCGILLYVSDVSVCETNRGT